MIYVELVAELEYACLGSMVCCFATCPSRAFWDSLKKNRWCIKSQEHAPIRVQGQATSQMNFRGSTIKYRVLMVKLTPQHSACLNETNLKSVYLYHLYFCWFPVVGKDWCVLLINKHLFAILDQVGTSCNTPFTTLMLLQSPHFQQKRP